MFNKEKTPTQTERSSGSSATLISPGTLLQGDVSSDSDLRIDGTINGNVTSASKVIIGDTGVVEGNVSGLQADINGKVIGNISTKELLQLRGQCNVQGNISAGKLQVEPTAIFNGMCQMGSVGNIVQMSSNETQADSK
ncbi:MAG: polymer-forming cytoskeletal protein [Chitinophagaceae bacterium]